MKQTLAIAGREIRAALTSPIGYVFVALFAGLSLFVFFFKESFFTSDQASVRGFFRWMPYLLLFVAPALTMRLWAEEKKLGTYEILATLPLTSAQLVWGKFLAALWFLAFALLFTLGIPVVASQFGDLDWGPVIGGYVGAMLVGSAYLAMGLVCSALVQEQLLALFLGWTLCALTLLPDAPFWESLFQNAPWIQSLRTIGFGSRFASVERGVLDVEDLLFYASVTGFFLFLNVALIRGRRFST
jgi:ABC-2 type transport system permease protein